MSSFNDVHNAALAFLNANNAVDAGSSPARGSAAKHSARLRRKRDMALKRLHKAILEHEITNGEAS